VKPTKVYNATTRKWTLTGLPEATQRHRYDLSPDDGRVFDGSVTFTWVPEPWVAAALVSEGWTVVDGVLRPPKRDP
jgi:hypothetical protein